MAGPEEPPPSGLFSLLLRADDYPPSATWVPPAARRCVVFLHGWLQEHSCWLTTAHRVRAAHGHDCLLLDWPAHGRSEAPADPRITIHTLVRCVRHTLERARLTATPRRLVFAAASLGGAVAMHYTTLYAEEVDRLVLVAPAGFDEPCHRLCHVGPLLAALHTREQLPLRVRAKLSLVQHTPRYLAPPNWFASAAARVTPTLLVYAAFDELHRANAWAGARAADRRFRMRRFCGTHAMVCLALTSLRLDLDAAAWHETDSPEAGGVCSSASASHAELSPQRSRL
ncbi:hypothetical protein AB1Y20_000284 [Prymnesium parvum]|uniref:AB hydrolase-1 domain-containing protein n=1 Tax=Prymnesium parvum TaxID=97485 RepID=A0AB34K9N5_PRYPA